MIKTKTAARWKQKYWGAAVMGAWCSAAAWGQAVVPATVPGMQAATQEAATPTIFPPAQTTEELQDRYQAILRLLRTPPRTGVLIAEFNPNSAARARGARLGDVISAYNDEAISTESSLRTSVATAIARGRVDVNASDTVTLQLRRDKELVRLQVPRQGLGVTGIGVEAGIPAPANPAATARDAFTLEWNKLPSTDPPPGQWLGNENWTQLLQGIDRDTQRLVGFECTRLRKATHTWTLEITSWQVVGGQQTGSENIAITFTPSNNRQSPGFSLETVAIEDPTAQTRTTAEKKGPRIVGTINTPLDTSPPNAPADATKNQDFSWPTAVPGSGDSLVGTVPVYAIPLVAAALPHQPGITMPFAQLNELDFQTRLGFVFQTLGKTKMKLEKTETTAWEVDVLHFGRVETRLWFSDNHELMRAELGGTLIAQQVPGEAEAHRGVLPDDNKK